MLSPLSDWCPYCSTSHATDYAPTETEKSTNCTIEFRQSFSQTNSGHDRAGYPAEREPVAATT